MKDYFILASGAVLLASGATWLMRHDAKVADRTTTKIVAASQAQGDKANAKSKAVRDAAAKPGAVGRLRADPSTCADCR